MCALLMSYDGHTHLKVKISSTQVSSLLKGNFTSGNVKLRKCEIIFEFGAF